MYPHLSEDCFDRWLADYDAFKDDFLRYCYFISKAVGYYPNIDFPRLKAAHAKWCERCDVWSHNYVMKDSDGLSHLKIMALLLTRLALVEWVEAIVEFDPTGDRREGEYYGTEEEYEETRKDVNAGRGTFLAFQFVTDVIDSFEISRDDKLQPFDSIRLTHDLEHDFMVFLLTERSHVTDTLLFEMATFLFFKALYARDDKPN